MKFRSIIGALSLLTFVCGKENLFNMRNSGKQEVQEVNKDDDEKYENHHYFKFKPHKESYNFFKIVLNNNPTVPALGGQGNIRYFDGMVVLDDGAKPHYEMLPSNIKLFTSNHWCFDMCKWMSEILNGDIDEA